MVSLLSLQSLVSGGSAPPADPGARRACHDPRWAPAPAFQGPDAHAGSTLMPVKPAGSRIGHDDGRRPPRLDLLGAR